MPVPPLPMAAFSVPAMAAAMIDQLDFGCVFTVEYSRLRLFKFIQYAAASGRHAGESLAWPHRDSNRGGTHSAEYSGQK